LLHRRFAKQAKPSGNVVYADRAVLQVRRHEILSVIAATESRRRQPELDYAPNVFIPMAADRVLEYRSQNAITSDLIVEPDHHVPHELSRKAGFFRTILEGQRSIHDEVSRSPPHMRGNQQRVRA
jgi:hypothetical protein